MFLDFFVKLNQFILNQTPNIIENDTSVIMKRTTIQPLVKEKVTNAVTIDGWSGCNGSKFQSLTVHETSETWELDSYALEVRELPGHHTSEKLGHALKEMLADWNVKKPKLVCVTDNGRNIVAAVRDHTEIRGIPCFANTLQLAIHDALSITEVSWPRSFQCELNYI